MKRTMRKDLFRAITKSKGRFFSIFLIVALGCGFFAGVKAAGPDMREAADKYYDDTRLMDLRLVSELGFTADNVSAVAGTDGVEEVMPSRQTTRTTVNEGENLDIRVQAISAGSGWKELNRLTVIRGRMPETASECVIDDRAVADGVYSVGQTITFENTEDTENSILDGNTFTIVGTADSPLYISFSSSSDMIGSSEPDYNIFVTSEAFTGDIYTDIYIISSNAGALMCYGDEYTNNIDALTAGVKETGAVQSAARLDEVTAQKKAELAQAAAEQAAQNSDVQGDQTTAQADQAAEQTAQTAAAQAALEEITNTWYYLDRTSCPGYATFKDDAARIDSIAAVFPLFFFVVAALVSLTTMTRMVDEDRMEIGSIKALGYSRRSIAAKYVSYAVLASVLGGLFGLVVGFKLFPWVIFSAYQIMYRLPSIDPPFRFDLAWITIAAAMLCTSVAGLFSVLSSLHSTPAMLMRPKAPKIGKRVFIERIRFLWRRLSFDQKVAARNLLRYKKRFFMTVIGIAGCTALMLTGFGLRNSVSGLVDKQYGEVMLYDLQIVFQNSMEDIGSDSTYQWFADSSEIRSITPVSAHGTAVSASAAGKSYDAALVVPSVPEDFTAYMDLHERVGKKALPLTDSGVIISEKLSILENVGVGDRITLAGVDDSDVSVIVDGVCENYTSHYVYMTPALYEKLYGTPPEANSAFAMMTDTSVSTINTFKDRIKEQANIAGTIFVPLLKVESAKTFASLDYVTVVLTVSAFALAMVVLYNLSYININERIREIATIKVLGFYDEEVSRYVFRENVVITILGAGLGLGMGVLLHGFVIGTAETDMIMFGRTIEVSSYILAFSLTVVFSLFVNLVMHFFLKRISMVESLKSVE